MESDLSFDRHERGRNTQQKHLPVICCFNYGSQEVLDYQMYRLPDKSSRNVNEVAQSVAEWARCLQVQI